MSQRVGSRVRSIGKVLLGIALGVGAPLAAQDQDQAQDQTTVATEAAVPSGWTARDIGAVGKAGQAQYQGGMFLISGAGADVWGSTDRFRFVYRTLKGNGTIEAKVDTLEKRTPLGQGRRHDARNPLGQFAPRLHARQPG